MTLFCVPGPETRVGSESMKSLTRVNTSHEKLVFLRLKSDSGDSSPPPPLMRSTEIFCAPRHEWPELGHGLWGSFLTAFGEAFLRFCDLSRS